MQARSRLFGRILRLLYPADIFMAFAAPVTAIGTITIQYSRNSSREPVKSSAAPNGRSMYAFPDAANSSGRAANATITALARCGMSDIPSRMPITPAMKSTLIAASIEIELKLSNSFRTPLAIAMPIGKAKRTAIPPSSGISVFSFLFQSSPTTPLSLIFLISGGMIRNAVMPDTTNAMIIAAVVRNPPDVKISAISTVISQGLINIDI